MMQVVREIAYQPFENYALTVGVTPTPLNNAFNFTKADLIDSFALSVDSGAANNVFIGGAGVTTANGLEIVRGAGPIEFVIENQRQHYEIQEPVIAIAETLQCNRTEPRQIPWIIWDFSQIYLIAVANTVVRVIPFRSMFI